MNERDDLLYFIQVADKTEHETLDAVNEAVKQLDAIDALYRRFIEGAGVVSPATAAILLLNAHANWRAAIRLSLSGQLPPVFMTLRGAIESALYANAMVRDRKLETIWLDRHKSVEARNRCKNAFTIKAMLKALAVAQNEQFAALIADHYAATIDFGAHPNSRSILSHLRIAELASGDHAIEMAYIHGHGAVETRQCLVACAEVGLGLLLIALICAPKHAQLRELNEAALGFDIPALLKTLGLNMDASPDAAQR